MPRSNTNRAESSNMASSIDQQSNYNRENAAIEASIACETRHVIERSQPRYTNVAYLPKQAKFKV